MHDDLIDAVDWAIEEQIAQHDQIAIMGASYGGYAALVGATFTPDRFACAVDLVGMSNLASLIESFPPYWRPFLNNSWDAYIGDPEIPEDRARMLARTPISRVGDVSKPIIIFQGENDPRVTPDQSDNFVAGLSASGIPYTYVLYPDEGHGFGRSENFESFYALTEQFLAGCLGGRSEPLGDILERTSATIVEGAELVGVTPQQD